MSTIDQLINLDKQALLALNGSKSLFWDGFMFIFTTTIVWVPVVVMLLYMIIKNNKGKEAIFVIITLALLIAACDGTANLTKHFFERFRPTQDPSIRDLIDTVNGYRGGQFGFISGHATNSFGLAVFLSWLVKRREFTLSIYLWALLFVYSRIYLGVHFPGDIIAGATVGTLIGLTFYYLHTLLNRKFFYKGGLKDINHPVSSLAYKLKEVQLLLIVLYLTYFGIIIGALSGVAIK